MADDTPTNNDLELSPLELSPLEPSPVEQELDGLSSQQLEGVERAPEAQAEPASAPPEPTIAATLRAEPLSAIAPAAGPSGEGEGEGEGGEWNLLLQKLRQWLDQNELQNIWAQASRPVTLLAALVGVLLVVRIYSALLGALDSVPLVPGLLELAGVVWLVRYGVPKLLHSSERERLLGGLNKAWKSFRGKG